MQSIALGKLLGRQRRFRNIFGHAAWLSTGSNVSASLGIGR
jgi:hypothetical protein